MHLEAARGETAVLTPTQLHPPQQSRDFCLQGVTPATVTTNAAGNQEVVVPQIWGQGSWPLYRRTSCVVFLFVCLWSVFLGLLWFLFPVFKSSS